MGLARAYTGRDRVLRIGGVSFHSHDGWYVGSTLCDVGVPEAIRALTLFAEYDDVAAVEQIFAAPPS
jgi:glutamate-1-semialdehyde 2,1-aminomutase